LNRFTQRRIYRVVFISRAASGVIPSLHAAGRRNEESLFGLRQNSIANY
jgi:hypothetical protein